MGGEMERRRKLTMDALALWQKRRRLAVWVEFVVLAGAPRAPEIVPQIVP